MDSLEPSFDPVDVDALTRALGVRTASITPHGLSVLAADGQVTILTADGARTALDISALAASPAGAPATERIAATAQSVLERLQEQFAAITDDPWPHRGPGGLPDPHAQLTDDRTTIRLLYGDPAQPLLELPPLIVSEFVR